MPRGVYTRKKKKTKMARAGNKLAQSVVATRRSNVLVPEDEHRFLTHGSTHLKEKVTGLQNEYDHLLAAADVLATFALLGSNPAKHIREACAEVKMQVLLSKSS